MYRVVFAPHAFARKVVFSFVLLQGVCYLISGIIRVIRLTPRLTDALGKHSRASNNRLSRVDRSWRFAIIGAEILAACGTRFASAHCTYTDDPASGIESHEQDIVPSAVAFTVFLETQNISEDTVV